MALQLSEAHLELIKAEGERAFPNECCGFLFGEEGEGERRVRSIFPAPNAREQSEQYHRFLITPEMYLVADRQARERGLSIVGFYHSHPNAPARPSQYDLEHAWPWYSYLIVSVQEGRAGEVTSWRLQDERQGFDEEKITITPTEVLA